MSGDGIILSIRSLGYDKIAQIKSEAQAQADEVVAAARAKHEALAQRFLISTEEQAQADALRQEHAEVIANGRKLAEVKAEFLAQVEQAAKERLRTLRTQPDYDELFYDLCLDALNDLGAGAVLHIDPVDESLAHGLLKVLDSKSEGLKLVADISTVGGVIATSRDGKITCDNTFEARLNRVNSERSAQIWEVLQR